MHEKLNIKQKEKFEDNKMMNLIAYSTILTLLIFMFVSFLIDSVLLAGLTLLFSIPVGLFVAYLGLVLSKLF